MWREWLTFSKTEQRGFFILISMCIILLVAISMRQCRSPRDGQIVIRHQSPKMSNRDISVIQYDTLQVNSAGATEMSKFGFPDRLIVNVLKYREAGGSYRNYSELQKTYGFDSANYSNRHSLFKYDFTSKSVQYKSEFKRIVQSPSIHLYYSSVQEMLSAGCPESFTDTIVKYRNLYYIAGSVRVDSLMQMNDFQLQQFLLSRIKGEKLVELPTGFATPSIVYLNSADTSDLIKVNGIGRYLAGRIIDYRHRLGGFVDVKQLVEIEGINENLLLENPETFVVDKSLVISVSINSSGVERLRRHPYINFYLAKEIVERRRVKGEFSDLRQVVGLPSFEKANPLLMQYLTLDKK